MNAKIFFTIIFSAFTTTVFSQDYVIIGNEKFDAGNYEGAIADYKTALTKNPKDADAYRNIGSAHQRLGHYSEAIEAYTKAINLKPNDKEIYYDRGFTKEDNGDHIGAIADFDKVLELDPAYIDVYFERGYSNNSSGNYTNAIADYTNYINKGGKSKAMAYYEMGFAKNRLFKNLEAIEDLKKAADAGKKDKFVFYETGFAHEGLAEWDKAITLYNKVIELDATYYEAWHGRGICKISSGNSESGCADLRKAKELGSMDVDLDLQDFCN